MSAPSGAPLWLVFFCERVNGDPSTRTTLLFASSSPPPAVPCPPNDLLKLARELAGKGTRGVTAAPERQRDTKSGDWVLCAGHDIKSDLRLPNLQEWPITSAAYFALLAFWFAVHNERALGYTPILREARFWREVPKGSLANQFKDLFNGRGSRASRDWTRCIRPFLAADGQHQKVGIDPAARARIQVWPPHERAEIEEWAVPGPLMSSQQTHAVELPGDPPGRGEALISPSPISGGLRAMFAADFGTIGELAQARMGLEATPYWAILQADLCGTISLEGGDSRALEIGYDLQTNAVDLSLLDNLEHRLAFTRLVAQLSGPDPCDCFRNQQPLRGVQCVACKRTLCVACAQRNDRECASCRRTLCAACIGIYRERGGLGSVRLLLPAACNLCGRWTCPECFGFGERDPKALVAIDLVERTCSPPAAVCTSCIPEAHRDRGLYRWAHERTQVNAPANILLASLAAPARITIPVTDAEILRWGMQLLPPPGERGGEAIQRVPDDEPHDLDAGKPLARLERRQATWALDLLIRRGDVITQIRDGIATFLLARETRDR